MKRLLAAAAIALIAGATAASAQPPSGHRPAYNQPAHGWRGSSSYNQSDWSRRPAHSGQAGYNAWSRYGDPWAPSSYRSLGDRSYPNYGVPPHSAPRAHW